jgi:diguanylate cyclase (GGDEF)-like protein/PAS domain S-box-containing protein
MLWMMTVDRRKEKRRANDVHGVEDLNKRHEFLMQNTRDIILAVRYRDRKILEANAAALKTYQYTIDELRSMTIDDLRATDASDQNSPLLDIAVSHSGLFETIHVRKNRETFPVKVRLLGTMMGNERILLCVVRDISERKLSQEAVHESESNLRALLNAVTESLLLLDKDGTVLAANETFAKRLRVGIDKVIGANYYELLSADTAKERRKQADDVIRNVHPVRFETISNKRYIDQVIYPVCDDKGEVARLAIFGADITRRREMEKELEAMALSDQLTGLYNRRGFFTLATRELKRAERSANGMLLFFADLDGLKDINDQFGHEEGDRALMAAAKMLIQTFRTSDIISRIGGDEFAILVIDADEALMEKLLMRLYRLINNLNARRTHKSKLALSIGHAVYDPLNPTTLDELISQADQQMYKMKRIKYRRA